LAGHFNMPWRCPACRIEIRHNPTDAMPDPTADYRCHVCRLDLRFDWATRKMFIPPLQTDPLVNLRERPRHLTLIQFPTKPRNE